MMRCYANPYEGNENYIFFSYCHNDAAQVYPIIERLAAEGFRLWYDDGIHPGDDWPEMIATHLSKAKVCIAAISRASAESHNCRNELSFAIANNIPFVSIIIEDFPMPLGMQLQLSCSHYIKRDEYTEESFYQRLLSSPVLVDCRTAGCRASDAALKLWKQHICEYKAAQLPAAEAKPGNTGDMGWFGGSSKPEEDDYRRAEEARRRAEEEARRRAEEARRKAEEEARRRAEEEARRRAEEEARRRAEEEARRRAEEEARRKAEEEARRRAEEEARRRAEEEARRRAEEEARRRAEEEARRRAEEEARRRAEEEARRRAEEEARRRAEEEARRRAEEEARRRAEEEARRRAEEEARRREEEEARRRAETRAAATTVSNNNALLIRAKTGEIFRINREHMKLGKDSETDIVFSGNNAVNRVQAEINREGSSFTLTNMVSAFIFVNGKPLRMNKSAALGECDELRIAGELCFFVSGAAGERIAREKKLCMLVSKDSGEIRFLAEGVLPLNRYNQWKNNVLGDQRISRSKHAELHRRDGRCTLKDMGSTYGTFHNKRRLTGGEEVLLVNGDHIAIVETEFTYYETKGAV